MNSRNRDECELHEISVSKSNAHLVEREKKKSNLGCYKKSRKARRVTDTEKLHQQEHKKIYNSTANKKRKKSACSLKFAKELPQKSRKSIY